MKATITVTRAHLEKAIKLNGPVCTTCLMAVALSEHFATPIDVGFRTFGTNNNAPNFDSLKKITGETSQAAKSLINNFVDGEYHKLEKKLPMDVEVYYENG